VLLKNHDLRPKSNGLNGQIKQLQNDKAQLSYDINYYATERIKEKEARAKTWLVAPGESVIICHKTSRLR